jgi:hypothetical protein
MGHFALYLARLVQEALEPNADVIDSVADRRGIVALPFEPGPVWRDRGLPRLGWHGEPVFELSRPAIHALAGAGGTASCPKTRSAAQRTRDRASRTTADGTMSTPKPSHATPHAPATQPTANEPMMTPSRRCFARSCGASWRETGPASHAAVLSENSIGALCGLPPIVARPRLRAPWPRQNAPRRRHRPARNPRPHDARAVRDCPCRWRTRRPALPRMSRPARTRLPPMPSGRCPART